MPATVRPATETLAEEHKVLFLNCGRFTRSAFRPAVPFRPISKSYSLSERKSIRQDQKLVCPKFFFILEVINGCRNKTNTIETFSLGLAAGCFFLK